MPIKKNKVELLTPKQIEVIQLLEAGLTYKEIGEKLGLTEGTVKQHVHNIFIRLGVKNRMMAVREWNG